jgi:hypothetical protein
VSDFNALQIRGQPEEALSLLKEIYGVHIQMPREKYVLAFKETDDRLKCLIFLDACEALNFIQLIERLENHS